MNLLEWERIVKPTNWRMRVRMAKNIKQTFKLNRQYMISNRQDLECYRESPCETPRRGAADECLVQHPTSLEFTERNG